MNLQGAVWSDFGESKKPGDRSRGGDFAFKKTQNNPIICPFDRQIHLVQHVLEPACRTPVI